MIELIRFAYTPMGTFGKLTYKDFTCYTVERPWQNNEARKSCIPEGQYNLQWYNSPKFGRTLAVVGNTVSLFPDSNFKRSAILIHAGNTMDDLLGCIAPGSELGFVSGKWGVTGSKAATEKLLSLIDPINPGIISISQYNPR